MSGKLINAELLPHRYGFAFALHPTTEIKAMMQEDAFRLEVALAKLGNTVQLKRCHWISTPDGDLSTEWCTDCGYYKVRNLRRHDRKRRCDYILDGGWRTNHDHTPFCESCHAPLEGWLTEYGAKAELEHYAEFGFRPGNAFDARCLEEMLMGLSDEHLPEAIEIAKRFCAESGLLSDFATYTQSQDEEPRSGDTDGSASPEAGLTP